MRRDKSTNAKKVVFFFFSNVAVLISETLLIVTFNQDSCVHVYYTIDILPIRSDIVMASSSLSSFFLFLFTSTSVFQVSFFVRIFFFHYLILFNFIFYSSFFHLLVFFFCSYLPAPPSPSFSRF